MLLAYVLAFSALGSLGAVGGAAGLLAFPGLHARLRSPLVAYAVGTLLGATFLGILPRAIAQGGAEPVLATALAGMFAFFVLEKVLRLPHAHAHAGLGPRRHPAGALILTGDALHNFVDGVVIAAAFAISVPLGVMTSLAIVAHEVPQELGDFVILLESGWERRKAFWLNALSASPTIVGGLVGYLALGTLEPYLPFVLAIAAASFLYIASTDLAPMLHHEPQLGTSLVQALFFLLGIGTLYGLHRLMG